MFGRYRIEQVVGRGGMGVVVRATDVELQRTVALKFVAPELADDPTARERFLREARLAAAIEHPNIVPIHEVGEIDGTLFLAMRAIPGPDLATVLRRDAPLEPARTLAIATPLADALDAAHRRGLIHRDVKPGNVLLEPGEDGGPERPWLTDFGLTRRLADPAPMTVGGPLGTIDYVAPELIDGGPVGARTDQYSLACLIVHCLTGAPPWQGASDAAVLFAHVHGDRSTLAERMPGATAAVLARGLAAEPGDRYPDCRSLVAALAAAMTPAEPTSTGATAAATRTESATLPTPTPAPASVAVAAPAATSPRRSLRRPIAVVGLVAVLGAAGLAIAIPRPSGTPGPSAPPTEDPGTTAVGSPAPGARSGVIVFAGGEGDELDLWAVHPDETSPPQQLTDDPGTERWPVVLPNGGGIVYTAGPAKARDLWLLPLDGGPARQLTRRPGDDYAAAISPDGKKLLYTSDRDGDLDIWMMEDTGRGFREADAVNLTDAPGTDSNHEDIYPSWEPDGSAFVFASNRGAGADIWWLDPRRPGRPRNLIDDIVDPLRFVDMSPVVAPDGSVVWVGRRGHDDREVYRMTAGGDPVRVTELGDEVGRPAFAPVGDLMVAPVGRFADAVVPLETRLMFLGPNGAKRGVVQMDLKVATDPVWVSSLDPASPEPTEVPSPDA